MKRLLAFVLAALILVGCAPQNAPTDTLGTSSSSTAGTTAAPTIADSTTPPATELPTCSGHDGDPYENVNVEQFYANYTTACCNDDARYRSEHYLMSGSLEVPGQYVRTAADQPMENGQYIRNTDSFYTDDGETYVVVDSHGQPFLRVHRGGAYITLEEVAAYMYAFGGQNGSMPANYVSQKPTTIGTNLWGIYLRGNHTTFKGDTRRYPYEPELPNISGCGGKLNYFEMDIGTTGTDTGNGYEVAPYNDGKKITRGAARLIYARQDLNGDGQYSQDEIFVFYTANHYNDFQEYLNYYGGWGEIFGNITGGGSLSSKQDYNPTAYVQTAYASFKEYFQTAY